MSVIKGILFLTLCTFVTVILAVNAPQTIQNQTNQSNVFSQNYLKNNKKIKQDNQFNLNLFTTALKNHVVLSGGSNIQGLISNFTTEDSFVKPSAKKLKLNAVFLNFNVLLSKALSLFISLNDEPDEVNTSGGVGGFEVQQAYLHIGYEEKSPFLVDIGKQFLPFSVYKIHPIVNSLTQLLDETVKTSLIFGYAKSPIFFSGYIFNAQGSSNGNITPTNQIYNGGAELGIVHVSENFGYDISLGWINNMAEAKQIFGLVPVTRHKVGNLAFHADIDIKKFSASLDVSYPVSRFNINDISYNNQGARPSAYGIELTYYIPFFKFAGDLSLGYQRSFQALFLALPKYRYLATYTITFNENIDFKTEVLRAKDYDTNDLATFLTNNNVTFARAGTNLWNNSLLFQLELHF